MGMKHGLFNPFFNGNYTNEFDYSSSSQGGGALPDPDDVVGTNITADGRQAFLIIGDSTARGSNDNTGPGPEPEAGTAYYWTDDNEIVEIGANDLELATKAPLNGSPWPKFAIDFYTKTAKKAVIIPCGSGGADYADTADGNTWHTNGNLYSAAITDAQGCLADMGLTKLRAIFINCGINDSTTATALSQVETAINSLITRLQTDFPDTDIVFSQIGRNATGTSTSRIVAIRQYIKNAAENNDRVFLVGGFLSAQGAGHMTAGNVHIVQDGQNIVGEIYARWMANYSYSKWARSIISSHYDDLSDERKALISGIDDHLTSYLNHEGLFNFKTSTKNNIFHDWAFLNCITDGSIDFTADSHIASDGLAKHLKLGYIPGLYVSTYKSALNDKFAAVKIKTNSTAAGTGATVLGCSNGSSTDGLQLTQTATNVLQYRANDNTATQDGTDTSFQNDTEYMAVRDSGNKSLYKNGTSIDSAAVAATDQSDVELVLGANSNNGVIAGYINASYEYVRLGKHVNTDHAAFLTFMENVIDNW